MNDTPENKAAQHIAEMQEFHAENQRLIRSVRHDHMAAMVLNHEQQIKDIATHLLELKRVVTPMMEFKRREGVWLTDAETTELWDAVDGRDISELIRRVQDRLKEKNT